MSADAGVTAMGIDHVRLSYLYLDQGDLDGYGSLFAADARIVRPGERVVRAQVESGHAGLSVGKHVVEEVFGVDDRVTVTGRLTHRATGREVGFADVFALSEHGLLRFQKTYFFIAPG